MMIKCMVGMKILRVGRRGNRWIYFTGSAKFTTTRNVNVKKECGNNMEVLDIWNDLGYIEGFLFSLWIGMMYYGKCWVDSKFK